MPYTPSRVRPTRRHDPFDLGAIVQPIQQGIVALAEFGQYEKDRKVREAQDAEERAYETTRREREQQTWDRQDQQARDEDQVNAVIPKFRDPETGAINYKGLIKEVDAINPRYSGQFMANLDAQTRQVLETERELGLKAGRALATMLQMADEQAAEAYRQTLTKWRQDGTLPDTIDVPDEWDRSWADLAVSELRGSEDVFRTLDKHRETEAARKTKELDDARAAKVKNFRMVDNMLVRQPNGTWVQQPVQYDEKGTGFYLPGQVDTPLAPGSVKVVPPRTPAERDEWSRWNGEYKTYVDAHDKQQETAYRTDKDGNVAMDDAGRPIRAQYQPPKSFDEWVVDTKKGRPPGRPERRNPAPTTTPIVQAPASNQVTVDGIPLTIAPSKGTVTDIVPPETMRGAKMVPGSPLIGQEKTIQTGPNKGRRAVIIAHYTNGDLYMVPVE